MRFHAPAFETLPNPVSFRGVAPVHLIPINAMRWGSVVNNHHASSAHHETHVHGGIHVSTPADGRRVVRDLEAALRTRSLVWEADRGLA